MPILFKYIIRELLKTMARLMVVVVVIYLTVDCLAKIDKFVEAGATGATMLIFFALKTPLIVLQITPVAVLIATLVVCGMLHRNNEVVAIKSSGINPRVLLRPIVITGIACCLGVFLLSEWIVPLTTSRANLTWLKDVRKKKSTTAKQNDIWIKDGRTVLHINRYHSEKQVAYGVTLNDFDKNFNLLRRVDAETGRYDGRGWVLKNLQTLYYDADGLVARTELADKQVVQLDILPQDLGRAARQAEEMGLMELYRLIQRVADEGYDATSYWVALHAKLAFPLICLLMSLIGAGLGLSGRSRGGMTANIAYGLGASFFYWIIYSFSLSLGNGGMLPPFLAAWSANIMFAGVAVPLVWKIK